MSASAMPTPSGSTTRLYELLGVSPTATANEIKMAYHRKALELHPDKNPGDESASDRMVRLNAAYEVLKDETRRNAYDTYGDAGVRAVDNPYARELAKRLGKNAMVVAGSLLGLFLVLCAAAVLISIALRVDNVTSWSWGATLFGLWIFNSVLGIFIVFLCTMYVRNLLFPDPECELTKPVPFIALAVFLIWVLSCAFVSTNLDYQWTSWPFALIPQFVLELIHILFAVRHIRPSRLREKLKSQTGIEPRWWTIVAMISHKVFELLERPVFAVLLCLQLTGVVHLSWFLVFISVYPLAVSTIVLSIAMAYEQVRMDREQLGQSVCTVLLIALAMLVWLSGVLLLAAKLDGAPFSLSVTFIPFFIALAVHLWIFLASLIFGCLSTNQTLQEMKEEDIDITAACPSRKDKKAKDDENKDYVNSADGLIIIAPPAADDLI